MSALPVNVISDICDQVAAWQEAFISEASLDRFRRAAAWTMSEVAKAASQGATEGIDDAFQDPTPWMRKAFGYTRALTRSGDEVSAELFVKPSQSIVLKYGMGEGPQIRRPGDVGLAKDRILVPNWRNLALTQGITRNAYGNVPAASRLVSPGKRQARGPGAAWLAGGASTRARSTSAARASWGTSRAPRAIWRPSARTVGRSWPTLAARVPSSSRSTRPPTSR